MISRPGDGHGAPSTPAGIRSIGAVPVDRSRGVALWKQVLDDVTRRIEAREFDDAFPGENVLRAEYGVSRQTVRQALRSLRESGLVTAARGRPPQLVAPAIQQPLGTLYSLFASVEAAGMNQTSQVRVLDRRTAPDAAEKLDLNSDAELVYLERLRLADGEPLALDRAWLPARLAAPLLDADFTHTALYREMAQLCGIEPRGGREAIDAVVLTPGEAADLQTATGSAAFSVFRLGCASGQKVEWRHTLVRADRFRVTTQFSPTAGIQVQMSTERA